MHITNKQKYTSINMIFKDCQEVFIEGSDEEFESSQNDEEFEDLKEIEIE